MQRGWGAPLGTVERLYEQWLVDVKGLDGYERVCALARMRHTRKSAPAKMQRAASAHAHGRECTHCQSMQ